MSRLEVWKEHHKSDDGGPAFPTVAMTEGGYVGMTLRQWYAGMALQGILSSYATINNIASAEASAKEAWERADAMLKQQEAQP